VWFGIQNEKAADVDVGVGCQGRSGVETETWLALHELKTLVAIILAQVVNHQEAVLTFFSVVGRERNSSLTHTPGVGGHGRTAIPDAIASGLVITDLASASALGEDKLRLTI
jgi:hypothetical protein